MPTWIVTTRAEIIRTYRVDAADKKGAIEASFLVAPKAESEIEEETLSVDLEED